MICLNCGCKLDLGVKFCPHCGKETPLNNENNIGKITIVREKKMLGFAIPSLTTRSTLSMHEIKLVSTEKDVIENIELSEDKKEVTITIIPKMGLISAKPYIKEIKYN